MDDPRGVLEEFAERAAAAVSPDELAYGFGPVLNGKSDNKLGFNSYRHDNKIGELRKKLSDAVVTAIRASSKTSRELAEELGVSMRQIQRIRKGTRRA